MAQLDNQNKTIAENNANRDEPRRQVGSQGTSPSHDIRRVDNTGVNQPGDESTEQNHKDWHPTSYVLGAEDPVDTDNENSDA